MSRNAGYRSAMDGCAASAKSHCHPLARASAIAASAHPPVHSRLFRPTCTSVVGTAGRRASLRNASVAGSAACTLCRRHSWNASCCACILRHPHGSNRSTPWLSGGKRHCASTWTGCSGVSSGGCVAGSFASHSRDSAAGDDSSSRTLCAPSFTGQTRTPNAYHPST